MKTLLTVVALIGGMATAYSQGRVKFFNDRYTLIKYVPAGSSEAVDLPATPGMFYFALFMAPVGTTDPSAFMFTGSHATNLAAADRISGGTVDVPGVPAGTHLAMLVRGWSANAGTTWTAAQNFRADPKEDYWYGVSGIASTVVTGGSVPAGTIFSTMIAGATVGFTLDYFPVPEPSAFALAGLAAALLMFRRHK
jgi:hypothetical protein